MLGPGNTDPGEEDRLKAGRTEVGYLPFIPTSSCQAMNEGEGRQVGTFLQFPRLTPFLMGSQGWSDEGEVSEANWSALGSCRDVGEEGGGFEGSPREVRATGLPLREKGSISFSSGVFLSFFFFRR